jgi:cbb3-type cytochrome oxidase subunit 3
MVNYAFNLGMWTILFFILGMYKPQWPLFFLKKPDRFMIVVITTILVMITFTLYGEGTRRAKLEQAAKLPVPQDVAPVPAPVPVPAPETPVKK